MSFEKKELHENRDFEGSKFREEVFSKVIRAGKRTYFFDVKATRKRELYLTITESKKKNDTVGQAFFEKHKIFLYKEDFEKFTEGLEDILKYIKENQIEFDPEFSGETDDEYEEDFSSVEFEDLAR
jgi:hypothetical protein